MKNEEDGDESDDAAAEIDESTTEIEDALEKQNSILKSLNLRPETSYFPIYPLFLSNEKTDFQMAMNFSFFIIYFLF